MPSASSAAPGEGWAPLPSPHTHSQELQRRGGCGQTCRVCSFSDLSGPSCCRVSGQWPPRPPESVLLSTGAWTGRLVCAQAGSLSSWQGQPLGAGHCAEASAGTIWCPRPFWVPRWSQRPGTVLVGQPCPGSLTNSSLALQHHFYLSPEHTIDHVALRLTREAAASRAGHRHGPARERACMGTGLRRGSSVPSYGGLTSCLTMGRQS